MSQLVTLDNGRLTTGNVSLSLDNTLLDAFGRVAVANPARLFYCDLQLDNAPLIWDDQQTSGSGTSSAYNANQASVTLSVGSSTAGTRVRQTFRSIGYQPGAGQRVMMTGILGSVTSGITRRIGQFNDKNGFYFESNGTDIRLVIRTYTSGSVSNANYVTQANWNLDKLDGTGTSGVTIDWNKTQIFCIDYEWLGVGSVWFSVYIDGRKTLLHRFDCANHNTLVYSSEPNLPLRYEISNNGSGAASSMVCICSMAESYGGISGLGVERHASRFTTALTTANNNTTWYPLTVIRLRTGYNGRQVYVSGGEVLCITANVHFLWAIFLNPTVTGTALSYSNIDTSASGVEAATGNTNATSVSGGTIITMGLGSTQSSRLPFGESSTFIPSYLGVSIAGTSDIACLAVRNITAGSNDFYGQLSFSEG